MNQQFIAQQVDRIAVDKTSAAPVRMDEPDNSDAFGGPPDEPMQTSAMSSLSVKSISPKKLIAPSAYQPPLPPVKTAVPQQKKVKLEKTDVSDILGRPAHWGAASSSGFNRPRVVRPHVTMPQHSVGRTDGSKRPKLALSQRERGVSSIESMNPTQLSFQPSWLRTGSSVPSKQSQQQQQQRQQSQWNKSTEHLQSQSHMGDGPEELPMPLSDDVEPAAGYSPSAPVSEQRPFRQSVGSTSGGSGGALRFAGRPKGGAREEANTHSSPVQHNRGPARPGTLKHLLLKCARGADADELKLVELPFTERVSGYQTGERVSGSTDQRSASKDPLDPRNRAREKVELQIVLEAPSGTTPVVDTTTVISAGARKKNSVVHWPSYGPFRVFVAQVLAMEGESSRRQTARQLFTNATTADATINENEPVSTGEPNVSVNDGDDVHKDGEQQQEEAPGLTVGSSVLILIKADSCTDDSRQLEPSSSVRVFDPVQVSLNPFLSALVSQLSRTKIAAHSGNERMTGVISETASLASSSQVPSFEDIKSALICTQLWEPIES